MKSKFKYILSSCVLALSMTACDINRLPETSISDATFWRSETDLIAANNYLYTFIPGFNNEDVWSDDAIGLTSNSISDGSRLAPSTDGNYTTPYQLIRAANNIVEKAPRAAATTSQAVIDRYLGEARFFRAWGYFSLVQKYGDVPLILKTLDDSSPELTEAASPREKIFDQIYQDLDFAASKLPTMSALGTANYGRISNTAALAFKARVALFEGTRSKFHSYGDYKKHLTLAAAAAKAVIDSRQHSLYANYFNLFQYEGEGFQNKENIIVKQYGVSLTDRVLTHTYYRGTIENGNKNPTKSLVDSYLMSDGLPITKSPLYKAPVKSTDVFTNRDDRLNQTVMKAGDPYIFTKKVFDVAVLVFQKTGFCFRKFSNIDDWNNQASSIDRPILRYAEVLLTYAEAKYELDEAISDADLDLAINPLRTRGKIAKLSNAFVTANGLNMREELRRERRVELAQEGHRYWDLIRWKAAEIELPKPILGNYFFKSEFGTTTTVNLTPDNYILVTAANFRRFDPAKDYLWPLPLNEISLNPNLKQNPNW
ncbi:RagB/SusD domain-containing protein [Emticicia oligotrophica DSM 17448]|uniref:RagB/SusD domain-containing protein n=1 Tax=Emticicia oligotrophica (strain DSM 17448 / CIP 109782 / MTCC 6937 / GPTSA100-15) TaxID=929562 RepID=A0ABN4AI44_EMTOG|nr:RagB/SusD family nutrient uptake outer membrane protein [Emticicia oligotrophica]AFK01571.1 RagB/SusD domain-containing protein [Emticicia oligotrophica DSM 17448]